jgi:hypothetical protein
MFGDDIAVRDAFEFECKLFGHLLSAFKRDVFVAMNGDDVVERSVNG